MMAEDHLGDPDKTPEKPGQKRSPGRKFKNLSSLKAGCSQEKVPHESMHM